MKVSVIYLEEGSIAAMGVGVSGGMGASGSTAGMSPIGGQRLAKVEIGDQAAGMPPDDIARHFKVEREGRNAKLVRRASGGKA